MGLGFRVGAFEGVSGLSIGHVSGYRTSLGRVAMVKKLARVSYSPKEKLGLLGYWLTNSPVASFVLLCVNDSSSKTAFLLEPSQTRLPKRDPILSQPPSRSPNPQLLTEPPRGTRSRTQEPPQRADLGLQGGPRKPGEFASRRRLKGVFLGAFGPARNP